MRFERTRPMHRFLGAVIAFVGSMILYHDHAIWTSLAWGAGLTLVGILLVGARGGSFIDFPARQVVTYFGWVVPWGRERRPFSSLRVVAVDGRKRGSNSLGRGAYEFPVELRGEGPDVRLVEPFSYANARRLAVTLANKMGLALSDHGVERPSGFVDETLRDRLLRTGAIPGQEVVDPSDPYRNVVSTRKPPAAPAGTDITVEDGADRTVLEVPARFGFPLAAGLFTGFLFMTAVPILAVNELAFNVTWFTIWMPFTLFMLAVWLRGRTGRWRITVDSRSLTVDKCPWLFTRRRVFSVGELDDVHVASAVEPRYHDLTTVFSHKKTAGFVVVRSDARAIPIGVGRSTEELDWLVARIQHAIARHALAQHSTGAANPL
jgi:hypothetical protein